MTAQVQKVLFSCDRFSCGTSVLSRERKIWDCWLTLLIWIFGFVKVLLVGSCDQAFECPRRLRLKDFSSRCDDGVEAGVFFRLRAITCFFISEKFQNFWEICPETSTCASNAAIRKSFPSTWLRAKSGQIVGFVSTSNIKLHGVG